jgi:hypothetical protein
MRINLKAVILSALVIPGLGQLHKGEKLKGAIIIALVNLFLLAALFVIFQTVGHLLVGKVTGSIDPTAVLENLKTHSPLARWLLAAFSGLWIYSVVDAARK